MHGKGKVKRDELTVADLMGEASPVGSADEAQKRLEVWAANVGTVVFAKG